MAEKNTRRAKRRAAKRKRGIYRFITVMVVIVALVLAVNFLLRVETIEVLGAEHYTEEEVAAASGIKIGSCTYLVNKFNAVDRIVEKLPYIQDVDIYRDLPTTIVISIKERTPSAMIQFSSDYWMLDESCRVLDKVTTLEEVSSTTSVIGLTPSSANKGEDLLVPMEQQKSLSQLKVVLSALSQEGEVGVFTTIDVSDPSNVICTYDAGRITVEFGDCSDMQYRVRFFRAILEEQSDEVSGVIDLRDTESATFSGV